MVERYSPSHENWGRVPMEPDATGCYVHYSDYADLERQIVELRAERDEARRHCSVKDKVAKAYYDNWRDAEAEIARLKALPLKDEVERVVEPEGEPVTLAACPIGLFEADSGELCLKTEYGSNEGRIDAYIVSSGEFFWGGTVRPADQREVIVQPVAVRAALSEQKGERG